MTNDLSLTETARLFALMNVGPERWAADVVSRASIHYELWRPITAIQQADEDGNDLTEGEADWMTEHPTTPPYPAYASNASTIGAACATVLTDVFGPDVTFEINWSQGDRSYDNFWAAADEQADARVYGGIHFRFDCVAGQEIGADVGEYVLDNYFQPLTGSSGGSLAAVLPKDGGASRSQAATSSSNPEIFIAPSAIAAASGNLNILVSSTEVEHPGPVAELPPVEPQPAPAPVRAEFNLGLVLRRRSWP